MISIKSWETDFFKKNIWELNLKNKSELDVLPNGLITTKINSSDISQIKLIQEAGFVFSEGEVIFEYNIAPNSNLIETNTSLAQINMLDEIIDISQGMYSFSRFKEPWFSIKEKNLFYNTWIKNSLLKKLDDIFLVKLDKGKISGFVTIKIYKSYAKIGLIGVKASSRGKNIGTELLTAVKNECLRLGISKIIVSTQSSNITAIKFYEKNNFRLNDSYLWFYKEN